MSRLSGLGGASVLNKPLVAAAAVFALAAGSVRPASAWTTGTVDARVGDSTRTSVGVTSSGRVAVAWQNGLYGGGLWYATHSAKGWHKTEVDKDGFGCYDNTTGPSMQFRPGVGPRIASVCNAQAGSYEIPIMLAAQNDGSWTSKQVSHLDEYNDEENLRVTNVALCIDPSTGVPSIFTGDTNSADVTWFTNASGHWTHTWVFPPGNGFGVNGPYVACAYDGTTGSLSLAAKWNSQGPGSLAVYTYDATGKTWSQFYLPTDEAIGVPSLKFDGNGTAWIAYREGTSTASHLEVADLPAGAPSWTVTTVDGSAANTGLSPSLGIRAGEPAVAYYDQTDGNLRFATFDGTSWSTANVASTGTVGQFPSLRFNKTTPEISFWSVSGKSIRWAQG